MTHSATKMRHDDKPPCNPEIDDDGQDSKDYHDAVNLARYYRRQGMTARVKATEYGFTVQTDGMC